MFPLLQQQSLEEAKKWAAEWNMSVEDILVSQDDKFPKAVVAPKPTFVMGESLAAKRGWMNCQHICVICMHGT